MIEMNREASASASASRRHHEAVPLDRLIKPHLHPSQGNDEVLYRHPILAIWWCISRRLTDSDLAAEPFQKRLSRAWDKSFFASEAAAFNHP